MTFEELFILIGGIVVIIILMWVELAMITILRPLSFMIEAICKQKTGD